MFFKSQDNKLFFLLLSIAFISRIALVFAYGDSSLENEWDPLVRNLLSGRGYAYYAVDSHGVITAQFQASPDAVIPSAYMPPLYAWFLAIIAYFTGLGDWGIRVIELIQAVFGILTLLFVFQTAKLKFDIQTAWIAVSMLAIYPVMVYMPSQISAVNIYVFLNYLMIYLLVKWEFTEYKKRYLLMCGEISGLLMLSRPDFFIYFLFICLWFIIKAKDRVKTLGIYLIMTAVFIVPWIARNCFVFQRLIPITTSGGINLWEGLNKNAEGTRSNYVVPNIEISSDMRQAIDSLKPTQDYEIRRDRIFRDQALADFKDKPFREVKLAWIKFTFLWGHFWGIDYSYPGAKSAAYWFPWFLQLPFFIYGLYNAIKKRMELSLFYAYLIISTLVAMVFFVLPRYRIFILPIVILFAAYGIKEVSTLLIQKRTVVNAAENE